MRLAYFGLIVIISFLFFIPASVEAAGCVGLEQAKCINECVWELNKCIADPNIGAQATELEDGKCVNDGDCEADEVCKSEVCVAKESVGATCVDNNDCKTDKCDFGTGGTKICKCTKDVQCATGKTCNPNNGLCETQKAGGGSCVVDTDCLDGYKCPTYAGGGICRKKCTKDGECGAEICFKNEYCVPKMKIGEPCTKEADCAVGKCMEGVCKDPAALGGASTPSPAPVQPSGEKVIEDAMKKIDDVFPKEMSKSDDLASLAGKAISMMLGIIGSAALLVFLYSGIMWMTSGGNDKTISNAQRSMIWAAIGLFTVFFSYILVKYIITQAG